MTLLEKPLPPSCFIQEETKKTQIVLHTTGAGFPICAVNKYKNELVATSVPYIIDPAGTIWELYDETESWSYHISPLIFGRMGKWLPGEQDRKTIGIELVNYGVLKHVRGSSLFYTTPVDRNVPYCHEDDKDKYIDGKFRGEKYFQPFPQSQIQALGELIELLCDRHEIARNILDEDLTDRHCPQDIKHFSGVVTHANYRNDVYDIGSAQGAPIWDELRKRGFE